MKPFTVEIPIYAETEEEAMKFARDFYEFVLEKRSQGIAVTANKVCNALSMFKNNSMLINYLRK